jgi:RHS repeat-associated protein
MKIVKQLFFYLLCTLSCNAYAGNITVGWYIDDVTANAACNLSSENPCPGNSAFGYPRCESSFYYFSYFTINGTTFNYLSCILGYVDNSCLYTDSDTGLCSSTLPVPEKDLGQPEVCTGNPCDPATGNKYQQETDFSSTKTGLSFIRHYNSGSSDSDNDLGHGWTHQWAAKLVIETGKIKVQQADGRGETFTDNNGLWQGDSDTHLALTQDATGFTLVTDRGVTERYDLNGRILSQTTAVGLQTTYGYNSNNQVDTVTGPFGHTLGFSYDANNRIATMIDPDTKVTQYQYDSAGNLVKVIYPDTQFKLYHYENINLPNALTGISDENGDRFATFAYAADGKAISTEHAMTNNGSPQEHFGLSYDSATQTTVTDAAGTVEVMTFAENLNTKKLISRINQTDNKGLIRTYDAQNNVTSNTDAEGAITLYGYNASNQLTSITEASGKAEERTTQMAYLSPDLDLPTQISKPSVVASQSFQTDIQYNMDHTVKDITLNGYQPDGTAISRMTAFQYNNSGQVTQIDGPLTTVNDITTLSYHECTTGKECGLLASVTNGLGQSTSYDSYDNNGRIKQISSAVGVITNYNYDTRGRLTQILQTPPTGQGAPRTTGYTYDAAGQLKTLTTPDNIILTYVYDAAHDLLSISDNLGDLIEYSYDLKGNRTDENIYDPTGNIVRAVQTHYDHRNYVKTLYNGGGIYITQLIHDAVGNLVSEIDPNQNPATTHSYDALHRLQQTIDALSNPTDYQYDSHDQLKEVKAPNDIATQYIYDDFEQLIQETSQDRGITLYQYDVAGNLTSKTNGNNITSTFLYDPLNRVTHIDYPGTELDISYLYDTCPHGVGRLCSITDNHSQASYQYDPWGNLTEILNKNGTINYTTQYSYDAGDNLLSTTYPSGLHLAYQRDAIGRVSDVTSTWGGTNQTIASQIDYLPQGVLKSITFGNGLQEQRNFDLANRLKTQITLGLQDRTYGYDDAGNLLTANRGEGIATLPEFDPEITGEPSEDTADIAEEEGGASGEGEGEGSGQVTRNFSYQYDVLHRLVDETGTYGQRSYSYDANGNRLTRDKIDQLYDPQNLPTTTVTRNQSYIYPLNDQHLTQISTDKNGMTNTIDLGYDPTGNTLSRNNKVFTYDARNRTNSFSKNGVLIADYRYNGQGERVEKIKHKADGTQRTIHYHYDQQGQLLGLTRYNHAGLLKAHKEIIWVDNLPVAQITTRYNNDRTEKSRKLIYLHTDHLNAPRLATDSNQNQVWSWDSDAFGQGKPNTDPDQDGKKTFVPLRFPGQIASEGGLFYNYYRSYSPSTGRYITADSLGISGLMEALGSNFTGQDTNIYSYARNNSLLYIDPDGAIAIKVIIRAAIIAWRLYTGIRRPPEPPVNPPKPPVVKTPKPPKPPSCST